MNQSMAQKMEALMSSILTGSDDFSGRSMVGPTVPDEYKPHIRIGPVCIGRNVIIGAHATIMPGVVIHDGAGIGAYSLVKEDCDGDILYAGVPAKRVKQRSTEMWRLVEQLEARQRMERAT